jgi:hypothetical protein
MCTEAGYFTDQVEICLHRKDLDIAQSSLSN